VRLEDYVDPESLVAKVFQQKYYPNGTFMDSQLGGTLFMPGVGFGMERLFSQKV
jgi:hypothetical protein